MVYNLSRYFLMLLPREIDFLPFLEAKYAIITSRNRLFTICRGKTMNLSKFIGRNSELEKLNNLRKMPTARLAVIKGRRRIGKSRLLVEFGQSFDQCFTFSGLPPEKGIDAHIQRLEFNQQLKQQLKLDLPPSNDWTELFTRLKDNLPSGKTLIIFDEISWMASNSVTFLAKLKNAWDMLFSNHQQLVFVLCGSISSWIEENILASTGFLGRCSLIMNLEELNLKDSLLFWQHSNAISAMDKLIILSVTGGVPRYLEEIIPNHSAIDNISRLCFEKDGILFNEFDYIFSDLFSNRSHFYQKIIETLAKGPKEAKEIAALLKISQSGDIYQYLNELILSGFVSRDYSWHFNDGRLSKLSHYRLKDNYCRFYLKTILPNKEKIKNNLNNAFNMMNLPGLSGIIGLQFENLVLHNRNLVHKKLGLNISDIVSDNPFFQRKTSKQSALQIDYLIQTRFNTLYVCEIKFSRKVIRSEVIDEVKLKIKNLKKPRNFSCIPILIHFGELSESLEDANYFAKIINFENYFH